MRITESSIYQTKALFSIYQLKYFELINLEFFYCYLLNSRLFQLNNYAQMLDLNFTSNRLNESSYFFINEETEIKYILFDNIEFALQNQNKLQSINTYSEQDRFIKITQLIKPNEKIEFIDVKIIGNNLLQKFQESFFDNQEVTLIFLSASFIQIDIFTIQKNNGISSMVIADSDQVILNKIYIVQHAINGIYEQYDCFQQSIVNQYYYLLISIFDVPNIKINQLLIEKTQSINYPIIEIKTSISKIKTKYQIEFSELELTSNLILITNKIKQASIILIQSEANYLIDIINSRFEKNILHQYFQLDLINTGLIFNIDCQYCIVINNFCFIIQYFQVICSNKIFDLLDQFIKNYSIFSCTNSPNSILYIQTQNLKILNSIFTQNNLFDYSILQPYLYWGYEDNHEIFVEDILESFPIIVLTGNGKIVCQEIIIKNVTISNSTGPGLQIYLEKEAQINIQDTIISNISTQFLNDDENGGAFLFDTSAATSIQIQLKNIIAQNVFCRNRGGLIYIQNGLQNTIIKFENLVLNDIFSLQGSIIYIEFSVYKKSQQQIMFNHLEIKNTIQGYLQYLDKFIVKTDILIHYSLIDNQLIQLMHEIL